MNKPALHGFVVLLSVCFLPGTASAQSTDSPFDADTYLNHIKFLASDELGGRLPGTPGIERAAEYIADQFKQIGLEPAGVDDTWFQSLEVRRGKKIVDDEAELSIAEIDRRWQVRKDWIPFPFTEIGDVSGPLAFGGYGITAPKYDYDDYAEYDIDGKIVLIFRYEPWSGDPEAEFGGKNSTAHSYFYEKARLAAWEGAKALLVVNPPLRPGCEDTLYSFDSGSTGRTMDLPMVHISRELGEALVERAGLGALSELERKLDAERKPLSQDMNLTVTLKTGVGWDDVETRNVIGRLPGDGSSDQVLIVGAHYDHLGNVRSSFEADPKAPAQIHNGADDNASGTAAVIETARVLAAGPKLHRDVYFITFTAEEMGLLGSRYFVNHPTVSLERLCAMINYDMIGRLNQDKFTIFGTNTGTGLAEIVSTAAGRTGINFRAAEGMTGGSDQFHFYQHDIPVLFAFTGVHKDYHRPSDDWDKIDAAGAVKILDMFHSIIFELANLPQCPVFQDKAAPLAPGDDVKKPAAEHAKEEAPPEVGGAAPKYQGQHAGNSGEGEMPSRPKVRLGIIPDVTGGDSEPGLLVEAVLDNGPAKKAGFHDGDRILRIGDHAIRDIYAYMDSLSKHKPGDEVPVVVKRGEKEITLTIKLGESKGHKHHHEPED